MPNCNNMRLVYTAPDEGVTPFQEKRSVCVGSSWAAQDGLELIHCGITGVLNTAYDCDDQPSFPNPPQELAEDPHRPGPELETDSEVHKTTYLSPRVQFAKVGLIDGTKNPTGMMGLAAAVYMADQLWSLPEDPCPYLVNPYPTGGNLLIHCCSGRSRSVTVAALFIWYKWGASKQDTGLKSFTDVYSLVKEKRNDCLSRWTEGPCPLPFAPDYYTHEPPTVGMQEAAHELSRTFSELLPVPMGFPRRRWWWLGR